MICYTVVWSEESKYNNGTDWTSKECFQKHIAGACLLPLHGSDGNGCFHVPGALPHESMQSQSQLYRSFLWQYQQPHRNTNFHTEICVRNTG